MKKTHMKRSLLFLLASVGFAVLLSIPSSMKAQVAPNLGFANQFGVLGNSAVTGSTGAGTLVAGDVGSYPSPTISNFPPSRTVAPFTVHLAADSTVQQAHTDAQTAYNFLASQGGTPLNDNLSTNGIIGPGVYTLGAADLPASSTLTLNGAGIFIFNVASSLTINVSSAMIGSANPCNVYWRVGSSATLNGTNFFGTAIASASITVGGGTVTGRVLAGIGASGAVTMPGAGGNTIGGCSAAPQGPPPFNPALCPVISISPGTLADGIQGVAYIQTVAGNNGSAPYTYRVSSGTLPSGLTLSSTGVLSGTPTVVGRNTWQIQATDTNTCVGTASFTIAIAAVVPAAPVPVPVPVPVPAPVPAPGCPVIKIPQTTLPDMAVGVAYSTPLTASGGTAPYIFTLTTGTLPPGMTLSPAGVLSGTPTASGTSTFTIRGTDANACFLELSFTAVIPTAVPTLPQVFVFLLAMGLAGVGYIRLRRRVPPLRSR